MAMTSDQLKSISDALSSARLAPYRAAAGNDAGALQGYQSNISLSEALYPSLQLLEVSLRNRFEIMLTGKYGAQWFADARFLKVIAGQVEERQLQEAITGLTRRKRALSSGAVVAELSFGFWTGLLGNQYQGRFWGPGWQILFPHQNVIDPRLGLTPSFEKKVNAKLREIRFLRNRVFHHEPIWADAALPAKYQDIRLLSGWICPEVIDWADGTQMDRFPDVFKAITGQAILR